MSMQTRALEEIGDHQVMVVDAPVEVDVEFSIVEHSSVEAHHLSTPIENELRTDAPAPISMNPLCFVTSLFARVWGGRALCDFLKHSAASDELYGEAWDISSLHEHVSEVADGQHRGRTLTDLWNNHRNELIGSATHIDEEFPLLVKWLECRDWLSMQVHPDDQMAREILGQPRGKSEAWIVLEADPTARIYAGLKAGVTRDIFMEHLNAGTLIECLHSFVPQPMDCVVLPAGTIHAAGGGLLIAEIQQSSNATFRLFDWNRHGLDGKPRPLQIDLALEAIDWSQRPVNPTRPSQVANSSAGVHAEKLAELSAFHLERYVITHPWSAPHAGELTIWLVLDGSARLAHSDSGEQRDLTRGRTVLIPAAAGETVWTPSATGTATLLCVRLPGSDRSCR
jgi:mannose-6-phosphate isomerase